MSARLEDVGESDIRCSAHPRAYQLLLDSLLCSCSRRSIAKLQAVKEAGPRIAVLLAKARAPQKVPGHADDRGNLIADLRHEEGCASRARFTLLPTDELANQNVLPPLRRNAVGYRRQAGAIGGEWISLEDLAKSVNRLVAQSSGRRTHGKKNDLAVFRLWIDRSSHRIGVAIGRRRQRNGTRCVPLAPLRRELVRVVCERVICRRSVALAEKQRRSEQRERGPKKNYSHGGCSKVSADYSRECRKRRNSVFRTATNLPASRHHKNYRQDSACAEALLCDTK